ncbi:MAG: ankyrin repeat domain-containing protein [Desulfobacteraceae bacterium]|nr:ankyrin repeat domain-containing protein [Desulfobacteraceae bacterium]
MEYRSLEEAVFEGKSLADSVEYVQASGNPDELFSNRHGGCIGLLHFMVMRRAKPGVEVLLDLGADIELRTDEGDTPLLVATVMNNEELTKFLLEKGANANVKNEKGDTPLHIALTNDHENIAQILLDHGADLDVRNTMGISARQVMLHNQIRLRIPSGTVGLDGVLGVFEKKGSEDDLVRLLEFCKASLGTKIQQGMSPVKAKAIERKIEAFMHTQAEPASTAVEERAKHRRMQQIIQEVMAALTEDIS